MTVPRKYITILSHLLLWALVAHVYIGHLPLILDVKLPAEYWQKQPTMFVLLVFLYYFNTKWLVPRLLYREKRLTFILVHIAILIALLLVANIFDEMLGMREKMLQAFEQGFHCKLPINFNKWGKLDTSLLLNSCLLTGISTSSTLLNEWQKKLLQSEQLKQQQINSELSFLKAQIHPHFFFNTLNNIYSLTYIDIETSRKSLHKLSRMMRYMLYETESDHTSLVKEISFIKDYIELMQLRMNDLTTVTFDEPASLSDKPIAPMILLPFIENAFKHGTSGIYTGNILVRIKQQDNKLLLKVENNFYADRAASAETGGIGLSNTVRRLELIYGDKHSLTCGPGTDGKYRVRLELSL